MNLSIERALEILIVFLSLGFLHLEKYYIIAIIVIVCLIVLYKKSNTFPKKSQIVPLAIWGIIYTFYFILAGNGIVEGVVYYLLGPLSMCYIGLRMCEFTYSDIDSNFKRILIISLAFFAHGFLNVIISQRNGTFIYNTEFVYDIWSHVKNNRTIVGLYLTPIVCFGIPCLFFGDRKSQLLSKIVVVFSVMASLFATIAIGNRTLIAISIVLIFVCIMALLLFIKKKPKSFVIFLFIVLLVIFIYNKDFFGVRSFVESSYFLKRVESGGLIDNGRLSLYERLSKEWLSYAGGWITYSHEANSIYWTHNIWLDNYMYSGILGFVSFVVYSARVVITTIRMFRTSLQMLYKMIPMCVTIGILLNWAAEPILQANPYYFAVCIFIFATFEQIYYSRKNGDIN